MSQTTLMVLSVAGAWALFIALAVYLVLILRELHPAGGAPTSFLAKIRLGLRAIEVQTGHIVPEVTRLNRTLESIREGLRAIDNSLADTLVAVGRQEGRR
jgi:hypothetical protein